MSVSELRGSSVRRLAPALALLLALPVLPAAAEEAGDGPSTLGVFATAYLEGVQLGALLAAVEDEGEAEGPGDQEGAPADPCVEESDPEESDTEPADEEEGPDPEPAEEQAAEPEDEVAEEDAELAVDEDGLGCDDLEDPETTDAPLDEGAEDDLGGIDDEAEGLEERLTEGRGTIVSTVARCAPRGKGVRELFEGFRNHGAFVRAAAHGSTIELESGSYDLSTLEGAAALCAAVGDAAPEAPETAADDDADEVGGVPSEEVEDADLPAEGEELATASGDDEGSAGDRKGQRGAPAGDEQPRADAAPRGPGNGHGAQQAPGRANGNPGPTAPRAGGGASTEGEQDGRIGRGDSGGKGSGGDRGNAGGKGDGGGKGPKG
jgi:hypothetical protein